MLSFPRKQGASGVIASERSNLSLINFQFLISNGSGRSFPRQDRWEFSADSVKKIKKEYGFKNFILLKKMDTRGNRRAFLIANDKNKYVLKSLPYSEELKKRLEFLPKIKKQGVNIPAIIDTNSNKKYFLHSRDAFFLSEFLDLKENRPSEYFFKKLGSVVGKFHKIRKLDNKIPYLNISQKIESTKKTLLENKMSDQMRKKVTGFFDYFPNVSGLTIGLVHGDISYFNVLGEKKIYIVDFDDLSFGPVIYDLGQMIAFMFNLINFDFPKFGMKKRKISEPIFFKKGFELFLKRYSKKIKLSENDIEFLPKMAMLTCLENIYLESTKKIFMWNYKRFEKIERNQDLIKRLAKKYLLK